jgi:ureidoacrylate peracid hydrolase
LEGHIKEDSMEKRRVTLKAEPEPLDIDLDQTAALVVDMQNAFAAPGGMTERWGSDLSQAREPIANIKRLTEAVRRARSRVVYLCHVFSPDLHESGGPGSANWCKSLIVRDAVNHPELRDSLPIHGRWGVEVIPELTPRFGEPVVGKIRHNGFFQTNLDATLQTLGTKYLLICGTELSICVESTARDAFWHGYFVVLVVDACFSGPPASRREATVRNMLGSFGWVATTDEVVKALV